MPWIDVPAPTWEVLLAAGVIFVLRVFGVALSTVRMLVMMRGHKMLAVGLGFFEVFAYVLAISRVTHDLGNLWNILGYCFGFCAGTLVGMSLDDRVVTGHATVRVVSKLKGREVLEALHVAGYGATLQQGRGRDGDVAIVTSVLRRRDVEGLCRTAQQADPQSFVTVEEARTVLRGYLRVGQREK